MEEKIEKAQAGVRLRINQSGSESISRKTLLANRIFFSIISPRDCSDLWTRHQIHVTRCQTRITLAFIVII